MRDAQVRRVPVVSDMGRLVGAISIDDIVLVAQNVRAGADAASVVGFQAVGRVEQRERGLGSLSGFRDGVDHLFVTALVASEVRRAGIDPTRTPSTWPRPFHLARVGIEPEPGSGEARFVGRTRAAGNNATGRLINSRSCVVEPLPPAGGDRPVGRRPRTDSAGSSKSPNLSVRGTGQLHIEDRMNGRPRLQEIVVRVPPPVRRSRPPNSRNQPRPRPRSRSGRRLISRYCTTSA